MTYYSNNIYPDERINGQPKNVVSSPTLSGNERSQIRSAFG